MQAAFLELANPLLDSSVFVFDAKQLDLAVTKAIGLFSSVDADQMKNPFDDIDMATTPSASIASGAERVDTSGARDRSCSSMILSKPGSYDDDQAEDRGDGKDANEHKDPAVHAICELVSDAWLHGCIKAAQASLGLQWALPPSLVEELAQASQLLETLVSLIARRKTAAPEVEVDSTGESVLSCLQDLQVKFLRERLSLDRKSDK